MWLGRSAHTIRFASHVRLFTGVVRLELESTNPSPDNLSELDGLGLQPAEYELIDFSPRQKTR